MATHWLGEPRRRLVLLEQIIFEGRKVAVIPTISFSFLFFPREMNGLCLCFKMAAVPPETQNIPATNGGPAQAAPPYGPPSAAPVSSTGYVNRFASSSLANT